jgi:exopolyphosphatase/guanosine-5'-triphosphate,3'-diphosphate pyrophosphatase
VGWSSSVGSSGTIKAIRNTCIALEFCEDDLTLDALHELKALMLKSDQIEDLDLPGVKPERLLVLPAGLAILIALFEALDVDNMSFSVGALREGLLYDMAGRLRHEDVRERSINALCQRYHVDTDHAMRVEHTAMMIWAQVKHAWDIATPEYHDLLTWACRTHETGLTIAHSQFHKHSAYLVQHSDLGGFTQPEQQLLGFLVRSHRRKFPKDDFKLLPDNRQAAMKYLSCILRLSVILNRSRSSARLPAFDIKASDKGIKLCFPEGWLTNHPLTEADLNQEQDYLSNADLNLSIS